MTSRTRRLRMVARHELDDILTDADDNYRALCSCGFVTGLERQALRALAELDDHIDGEQ